MKHGRLYLHPQCNLDKHWSPFTLGTYEDIKAVGLTKTFPPAINGSHHFGNFVVDYHKLLVIVVAVGMMVLIELSRTLSLACKRAV